MTSAVVPAESDTGLGALEDAAPEGVALSVANADRPEVHRSAVDVEGPVSSVVEVAAFFMWLTKVGGGRNVDVRKAGVLEAAEVAKDALAIRSTKATEWREVCIFRLCGEVQLARGRCVCTLKNLLIDSGRTLYT